MRFWEWEREKEGALLHEQAAWLAPLRARVLRRAAIAHRTSVLDLGAGNGAVSSELARRAGGRVVAFDLAAAALRAGSFDTATNTAAPVCGSALALPFACGAFDLVFCQMVLLWVAPLAPALAEIARVLRGGGMLVAIEPDYGGMLEYPPAIATRDLWLAGLRHAGAEPLVGRRLPALLAAQGFAVQVDLLAHIEPPAAARFDLLRRLPLSRLERLRLWRAEQHDRRAAQRGPWARLVHLPLVVISATREPHRPKEHKEIRL